MRLFWIGVLLLTLVGCTKSGVEKSYDISATNSGAGNQTITVTLEATTDTDTTSGDAPVSTDPAVALGLQGSTTSAAAKGAEQMLKDIVSYAEQWLKKDADNVDNSDNSTTKPTEPVVPATPVEPTVPVVTPDQPVNQDTTITMTGWEVLKSFPCDQKMNFKDDEEIAAGAAGEEQNKCLLKDYNTCEELPKSFMLVWKEGTEVEQLMVPNNCNMTWVTKDKDYRKYRPLDDKEPHPVAYAARGTDPTDVYVLVKKQ